MNYPIVSSDNQFGLPSQQDQSDNRTGGSGHDESEQCYCDIEPNPSSMDFRLQVRGEWPVLSMHDPDNRTSSSLPNLNVNQRNEKEPFLPERKCIVIF